MKVITKTRVTEEPKLKIEHDPGATSPREWSNLGYFITKDSNHYSPDGERRETGREDDSYQPSWLLKEIIDETGDLAESQEEHMEMIKKKAKESGEKIVAIYPVVKYEHSGISYSLGTSHGFDYSNNGFYIVTDKTQKEIGAKKKDFEDIIKGEIEIYNQYVNGEVYSFVLYDDNGEHEDSCSGFYSLEDIREHLPKEWKDEDLEEYVKY